MRREMHEMELKLSPAIAMTAMSCRSMHTTVKTASTEMKVGRKMSVQIAMTPTTPCAGGTAQAEGGGGRAAGGGRRAAGGAGRG
jgi:hypothetical protein